MLPEGPAVWAEAPPTGETTPQREELTTQLTSPNTAHTCTITHIHKHTQTLSTYRSGRPNQILTLAVDCGAALCRLNTRERTLLLQPEQVILSFLYYSFINKEAVLNYIYLFIAFKAFCVIGKDCGL